MNKCKHSATQGVFDNTGLVISERCCDCGYTVYLYETRQCQYYAYFADGQLTVPLCRLKLMTVTRTMRVMYPIPGSSCFKPSAPA